MISELQTAVDQAFEAAGDLVETGSFSREGVTGFDWSTSSLVKTDPASTSVNVIVYEERQGSEPTLAIKAIVKQSEWPGEIYDTLTVGSVTYDIVNYVTYKVVVLLDLTRRPT